MYLCVCVYVSVVGMNEELCVGCEEEVVSVACCLERGVCVCVDALD